MKVALVGPVYPYRGGIAHYTTLLHQALVAQGAEVLLISFKRQYPAWLFPGRSDRDPSEKGTAIPEARYWIDSLNPFSWLATFSRLRRFLPELLVLQWWTSFWAPVWLVLGGLTRLFLQVPIVIICHNVLPHEAKVWDRWLTRMVLGLAGRLIVQSEAERRKVLQLLPKMDVAVVSHPVYPMFAQGRPERAEARQQLGLAAEGKILLFFGMVREYKGLADALRALPDIRAVFSDVTLLVAGEFWGDKGQYLALIERLKLKEAVVIRDAYVPDEEAALYFAAADLLVAPYRRATGSGVVQAAAGCGLPVIASAALAAGLSLGAGKVPPEIPTGDPAALAQAINRFFCGDVDVAWRFDQPELWTERATWEDLAACVTAGGRSA